MVRGQPTIDIVLPAFREFCEDTVLIAHNAAFDMRFLQLEGSVNRYPLRSRSSTPSCSPRSRIPTRNPTQARRHPGASGDHYRDPAQCDRRLSGDREVFLKLVPVLAEKGHLHAASGAGSLAADFTMLESGRDFRRSEPPPGPSPPRGRELAWRISAATDIPELVSAPGSDPACYELTSTVGLTGHVLQRPDLRSQRPHFPCASSNSPPRAPACPWCPGAGSPSISGSMREQTFVTDQDNGLLFSAADDAEAGALRELFLPFARAPMPIWTVKIHLLQRVKGWQSLVVSVHRRMAPLFHRLGPAAGTGSPDARHDLFDLRPLFGDLGLGESLLAKVLDLTSDTPAFSSSDGGECPSGPVPPLAFSVTWSPRRESMGDGRSEKNGARVFDAGRIFALASGYGRSPHRERLAEAGPAVGMTSDEVGARDALFTLFRLRLDRQADKLARASRLTMASFPMNCTIWTGPFCASACAKPSACSSGSVKLCALARGWQMAGPARFCPRPPLIRDRDRESEIYRPNCVPATPGSDSPATPLQQQPFCAACPLRPHERGKRSGSREPVQIAFFAVGSAFGPEDGVVAHFTSSSQAGSGPGRRVRLR